MVPAFLRAPWVRWVCLLLLCSAYLQGGFNKLTDFNSAIAEMQHFGVAPAAVFTVMATLMANRFWEMSGPERFSAANGFFEHLGLAGAFLLVAWLDLQDVNKE